MGTLFALIGGVIVLVGLRVIPVDPTTVHAPYWIITMAGLIFFFAGAKALTRGSLPEGANTVLAMLLVAMLATVFSWVAFGPGERAFSSSGSVGSVTVASDGGNEGTGRMVFGASAILLWLIVLGILVNGLRRLASMEQPPSRSTPPRHPDLS